MERTRRATLVVVSGAGRLRGVTGPVELPMPWWQETAPIVDLMPGAVVLRLLAAQPDRDEPMGGTVTYLVQHDGPLELEPWSGTLVDDPNRHPWARPGGPAADLQWARTHVDITGEPRQVRSWNLSAIWQLPTTTGPAWLKCVPPFMEHEAAALDALAGLPVPELIAAEGHRQLLADLPGTDGYAADAETQHRMVEALIDVHQACVDRVPDLLGRGVIDHRTERLIDDLGPFVERVAPTSTPLLRLVDELPDRLRVVDREGPPATLVHGDAHPGNCRMGVDPPVWFDWGDSFVGSPLFDIGTADRFPDVQRTFWVQRWSEAVPTGDLLGALRALEPILSLRLAWVYQRFLDNIERAEHVFHAEDVKECLRQTERWMTP